MLTVLTTLVILHYAGFLIFKNKRNNNTLFCGLFGWVGKDPKTFNKDKFDKLGMFNITRGKHSCGVAVDGKLYKGVNSTANYVDFITQKSFPSPKEIPVVIGHTRHATVGLQNADNAHPFKIDFTDNDNGFVIGAHNGTLKNHIELAKKYEISDATIKIDSQILIEIIANGNHEVLEEYRGAAALLIYSSSKPGTMYVFRGESQKAYHSTLVEEERPLFFYQENEESMYISSLKDSLKAITATEEEKTENIFEFKTNRLYEIKDGSIINRYIIDRSKVWDGFSYTSNSTVKSNNVNTNTTSAGSEDVVRPGFRQKTEGGTNSRVRETTTPSSRVSKIDAEKVNNIIYETVIHNNLSQEIYYENLRYKRTGHLVTSICIFVEELGFVMLCEKSSEVEGRLKSFNYYDKDIKSNIELGDITDTKLYYIVEGVLLKTKVDYIAATEGAFKNCNYIDLSKMSEYPVLDYSKVKKGKKELVKRNEQHVILDNELFTGNLSPLGMGVKYGFTNGKVDYTVILDDINIPYNSSDKVSLYEAIGDEQDDTDTFEESLTEEILNQSDNDMIDAIIEIGEEYDQANSSLLMLEEHAGKSTLVDMLIEFGTNVKKSFEPIALAIEELSNVKKESVNN